LEELQLALTTARVDQRNFGLWINNWQIGQTLNALVTNQLPSGDLVLRVAGQQITATADIPIQQGASLMLEVKQLQPVPTLRVLNPAVNATAKEVGGTLQLISGTQGLASVPLATVLQNLQTPTVSTAVPAAVLQSLGDLFRLLPRAERLTQVEGLTAAVQRSGIFLEPALAAERSGRPSGTAADFKAGMFRALAGVEGALAKVEALKLPAADVEALLEMKRDLEAGLGRLVLHQLASQPVEGQAGRHWQFEIPVLLAGQYHSVQLELEQEPREGSEGEEDSDQWRVRVALELPALGAVELQLALVGERVDLRVAAGTPQARALIDGALPELGRAMDSRGLQLRATAAAELVSRPPSAPSSEPPSTSLLDLRA